VLLALSLALACHGPTTDDSGPTGDTAPTAAPLRPAEPADWAAPGAVDAAAFPSGVLSGDASAQGVILAVRTDVIDLTVVVMAQDGQAWTEVARQSVTRDKGSRTAQVTIGGLAADTAHSFAFYAGDPDAGAARSAVGRFRTALDDSGYRQLTVASTSCLGGDEPWPSLSAAAARHPDLFANLGDVVYADGATDLEGYRSYWDAAMLQQGMVDMGTATSFVSTWDDHEVANNWYAEDLLPGQYEAAMQAYRESLPQGTGPTGGIWRQQHWGTVLDVFVLDSRSERDLASGKYLSDAQMAWLEQGLQDSTATFKLILSSVPVTDLSDMLGTAAADDRWQGWPTSRDEILSFIDDNQVTGVLWLSGDVHFAMVASVGIPGSGDPGEHQWEVAAGPGGSTNNIAADLYENDFSHYLTMFSDWNTVMLTFDPGLGTVTVEYLGDDGGTLDRLVLDPVTGTVVVP